MSFNLPKIKTLNNDFITLQNPEGTWSFFVSSNLPSQLFQELKDFDDCNNLDILIGKNDTPEETKKAIKKLKILVHLSSAIQKFNYPDFIVNLKKNNIINKDSFQTLQTLKNKIKGLWNQWKKLDDSSIYKWLLPDTNMTSIIDLFETFKTNPARWCLTYNITNDIQTTFWDACAAGNLSIVQWTVRCGAIIKKCKDFGFREAVKNGQLSTSKWLASQGAYVHAAYDEAIRYACDKKMLPMCEWLLSTYWFDWEDINDFYGINDGCNVPKEYWHLIKDGDENDHSYVAIKVDFYLKN